MLLNIDVNGDQIQLKTTKNDSETLAYDILVICTGGSYVSPWRDSGDDHLSTYEERLAEVKKVRE